MGLFDKFKSKSDIKLTPKAALALAGLTVIGVDGSIDDDEVSALTRLVRGDEYSFNSALTAYKELSVSDSVQMVAKVLEGKQRMACIAILLDLAMADGILVGDEQRLLQEYMAVFQLTDSDVSGIVDVIALKNDFSIFERASNSTGAAAFCQTCGSKLGAGVQFCPGCGKRV